MFDRAAASRGRREQTKRVVGPAGITHNVVQRRNMSEISREPSLATLIQQAGGAMNLVRNAPLTRWSPPGYPAEFASWRDEQRA